MTMTNEQIQALKAAAEKAIPAIERLSMMPSDELFDYALLNEKGDVDIANNFVSQANPVAILSLLVERDDDKKRIAELEARTLTVKLPKPHAHLIWIQAGHGPDDYWDDVSISRNEEDRCCDGSERYPVYSIFEIQEACADAGITLVVGE